MQPIGLGVYPDAELAEVRRAIPRAGVPVLVMGLAGDERHAIARALRDHGCDLTRRHWEAAGAQVDWNATPEANADRWLGLILGGLNPERFRAIYARAVGPNECYATSAPERFSYLATFELALCRQLHAAGIAYAWGSISVGNVDPVPFATTFAGINAVADAVCAHLYAAPGRANLEPPDMWEYARRPHAWWRECQRRGVRFPPLLGGESGTYASWTEMGLSSADYVALLGQIGEMLETWQAAGMPVIGHCAFAVGAQGAMGQRWNLDQTALDLIGAHNRQRGGSVSQDELERYCADIYRRAGVPFNPRSAFYTYWRNQLTSGRFLGFPEEAEHQTENGQYMVQAFATTILHCATSDWVVKEGLPPFT